MNKILVKFCEVEQRALQIYSNGYKPKDEIYDSLKWEFEPSYQDVLLIGIEAAAASWNFHNDVGPWMRDLKEKAGHFTRDDLESTRIYAKYK